MKVLLALVLSLGAFAINAGELEATATEKLTSYLPSGYYLGRNDQNEFCSVTVSEVNYPKKDVQVRVVAGAVDLTKLVEENSEFGYKDHKKEFIQTERSLVGVEVYNYVERIIRTVDAGEGKLYVLVSYSVVINRSSNTDVAECVINL